jgi:Spy/CpxP family protein refolding chaperone
MNIKKAALSLLLTCGLATAMFAQSTGTTQGTGTMPNPANRVQHQVNFLTTVLTLTSAQQQQATTIFTNAATANTTVFQSLKTARQSLWTAVQNNDSNSIASVTSNIGSLVAQMSATRAQAEAAFYQILTPDQQAKLTQLHSMPHGHFRP